ncbi:MAG TPA: DUF433 domain-containing protein [Candidatus Acidoferrales bacterium]|nr:DUF433 domain-containing protein [Candidatus Acidoferrales bacterium]
MRLRLNAARRQLGQQRRRIFFRWYDDLRDGKFVVVVVVSDLPDTRHWIASDMIRFAELVEIYRGFEASMGALHRFILKRIQHFEEVCMDYQARIIRDPKVCGGEPVIKGTRVTLRTALASLAEGATIKEILADFPTLTETDVRAVIAFAAASAEEDLPVPAIPGRR